MRVTIKDIAKKLGVSTAAVSKALNDVVGISDELRKKIKLTAKEMGYTPNIVAKNLVQKKTNKVAFFILSRNLESSRFALNEMEIFRYIINESHKLDYNILVFTTEYDDDNRKNSYIDLCISENVAGSIIMGLKIDDPQISRLRENSSFPTVIFDTSIGGNVNAVKTDNAIGVKKVADYLKEMNHSHVGVITGHFKAQVTLERLYSFTENMLGRDLETYEGDFTKNSGYLGAEILYKKGVTAIFAFSDLMALGAMDYFKENGIKVPEDISIIGFDDMPLSEISTPALTTVGHNKEKIAKEMFEIIINNKLGQEIKVEPKLIIRDSVKKL